jgi:signal transduction histidine kinase
MEMIRVYLDLSRIEKDEMPLHIQRTPIRAVVIDPVIKSLGNTIREQNAIIEIEMDEGLEWSLDPDLFRSVFTNLIDNACKYGEKSGRIRIRVVDLGGRCRMEVWNSGPGISKENQEQLFKKFRRLDICRQPSARGSGLGLFITKTIVERHDGRIWAESREGEWVNFIIELPAEPGGSSEELENEQTSSNRRESVSPTSNLKIGGTSNGAGEDSTD